MASLSALPALNEGFFEALILIVAPVRGLRPVRAARLRERNVPKPTSATLSPFFNAFVITSMTASTARPASALLSSAESATAETNSPLFMLCLSQKDIGERSPLDNRNHAKHVQAKTGLLAGFVAPRLLHRAGSGTREGRRE